MRGQMLRGWVVGILAALALCWAAAPAGAHAELESSDPRDGATLASAPAVITFVFGEEILAEGNAVTLTDVGADSRLQVGPVEVAGDTVSVTWPESSPAGEFRAAYRVVSADGHPINGTITFTVEAAVVPVGATAGASTTPGASASASAGPSDSGDPVASASASPAPVPVEDEADARAAGLGAGDRPGRPGRGGCRCLGDATDAMTTTAAPDAPDETRSAALGWSGRLPRVLWVVAALAALTLAAVVAGVRWEPVSDGLPDAGRVVVDGLPLLRLVSLLAGGAMVGFGLSAVALDPGARTSLTRSGRVDLAVAAASAFLLAGASVLFAVFTLADVLGIGLADLTAPGLVATYLWDVEVSRAFLITAALTLAVGAGFALVRSLGGAAGWLAVALVAVGIPSLTGHAAGLGGHSLALISGFLHTIAAAAWGGGVVALATHAVRRSPQMGERVRRFGVVAIASVATLAITGFASAATRMDSFSQLVTTPYGRTVLAKIIALAVAVLFGALVRRGWQHSAKGVGPGRMLAEVVALGSALGLAVVLARSAFPRQPVNLPSLGEDLIGYPYPPAPTFRGVALGWHPDWVWLTAALLAIAVYAAGYLLLRRRGDSWPAGRLVAWVLGWGVVIWATCAGVAWYAPVSFTLHMISHMALAMLAPVLLVLGAPITLALRVIPAATGGDRGPREWITWGLHSPVTRFVTHPAYVLFIYTVGLYGLYYTSLYSTLMSSHLGHFVMQVHFLAAGYLFYWVVIGVDAGPRRLGYPARLILLMASLVIHSFFAVPMMMTEVPMVADWYAVVMPPWLTDTLADTRNAGAIAWGFGEIPTLVVAIVLGFQWARSDEREARRLDRRAELDGDAELSAYNARLARMNAADVAEDQDR